MNFGLAAQKSDYTSKILSLSVSHLFFLTNLECLSSLLPSTSLRKCELFQKLSQPCFSLTPSILWLPSIHSEWILLPLPWPAPNLRTTSPPFLYVCIYISNFKVNTLKNEAADSRILSHLRKWQLQPYTSSRQSAWLSLPLTPYIFCMSPESTCCTKKLIYPISSFITWKK